MAFVPKFKLYDNTGLNLIYTFPVVQNTNIPKSTRKTTVIEGFRGQGGIIISGSDKRIWDIIIEGILFGDDYENLTTKIEEIESSVQMDTQYILRFEKTASTYFEYKVKRIDPIEYPQSFRTQYQDYRIILKANAWN